MCCCPNIGQEEDVKLQKVIREVSKGGCVDHFNHGHIQWKSLESAGGDYHQFLLLTQDCFLTQQNKGKGQEETPVKRGY